MTLQRSFVFALVLSIVGCGPMGEDTLDINVVPRTLFDDGQTATVTVVATTAKGTVGSGSVQLTVTAGQLADSTVTLDQFGTARTTWTCDKSVDPTCMGSVQISGTWAGSATGSAAKPVSGLATATVGPRTTGGGTGGGGGNSGLSHFAMDGLLVGNASDQLSASVTNDPTGNPISTRVGFPSHGRLILRNDNAIFYLNAGGAAQFVEDTLGRMSGGAFDYPDTPGTNDVAFATGCATIGIGFRGYARPDSNNLVFVCDNAGPVIENGGNMLTLNGGESPYGVGPGASMMVWTGSALAVADGATRKTVAPAIPGAPSISFDFTVTGTPTGFLVLTNAATAGACDLYSVDLNGASSKVGTFAVACPGARAGLPAGDSGALGRDGTLWRLSGATGQHVLTSYKADMSAGVVQTPGTIARGGTRPDYVYAN